VRVATWNVLAAAYALPQRYAGVPPDDLDAQFRMPRVEARIDSLLDSCDVVALQEVDGDLAAWLRDVASVVHAPRPSSIDGVVLASRRHELDGEAHATSDGRRSWATAQIDGVLLVSVHLDPEWPAKKLRGAVQAAQVVGSLEDHVGPVVILGDINSAWDGANGRALQWGGFDAGRVGATAATNGKARELDVVAARGCTATPQPTGLPDPGTPLWLPTADLPSDHAPLTATIDRAAP